MSQLDSEKKIFPEGFVWGAATAAHQVEGGNHNSDCWVMENAVPSFFRERSGEAIDQWNRFNDDVALLAALGLKVYRFSIEWARIEPEDGVFSQVALDHYQRCIDACLHRGVEPVLTFHHFTLPVWVVRKGGFSSPEFPALFERYCARSARSLRGFSTACTMNELNVPILVREMLQTFLKVAGGGVAREACERALGAPLESTFLFSSAEALIGNGLEAHRRGRDAIKAAHPHVKVGVTLSIQDEYALPGAEHVRDRRLADYVTPFLDAVRGDDFIGVQNYTRSVATPEGTSGPEPGHPLTMMGYEDRPQALAEVCRYVWEQTKTPIIVTESGWAGDNDRRRCAFIREALVHLHGVIAEGVDVRGYYYWSAFDNFEWIAGYGPRFGIISVDRRTQQRRLKPSALAYGLIAQENAVGLAMVAEDAALVPAPTEGPRLYGAPLGVG